MTVQISYRDNADLAEAGLLADTRGSIIVSGSNPAGIYKNSITWTAANSTTYNGTINGVAFTYTSDASATDAEIKAGLEASITSNAFLGLVDSPNRILRVLAGSPTTVVYEGITDETVLTVVDGANITTTALETGGINLPVGRAVVYNGSDEENEPIAGLPSGSGNKLFGFVMKSHAYAVSRYSIPESTSTVGGYDKSGVLPGRKANVVVQGSIWVEAEESFNPGDDVFYRFTSGAGGSIVGKVRTDADTATALQAPGWKAERYDSATGLVRIAKP